MPGNDDGRRTSGFLAFWGSLPGVLTGVAAVIAAAGTLGAVLFRDGGDASTDREPSPPSDVAQQTGSATTPAAGGSGCHERFLAAVPAARRDRVEAGTQDFDAITAGQPKGGPLGLLLTSADVPIGALRLRYFPANQLFKIEAVVDRRCAPVADVENIARGGDGTVLQNYDTARIRLGRDLYDLRMNASTTIRLGFVRFVP